MTKINRWIDELPEDSPDRALLGAGRSARPPEGSKDAAWRAIALSVGTAATTATLSAQATSALSANAGAGATIAASAAKGVVSATVLSIGIKSVAIGFAAGIGLLAAGKVADRVTRQAPAASTARMSPAPRAVASQQPLPQTFTTRQPASSVPAMAMSADADPLVPTREFATLRPLVSQPRRVEPSEIGQSTPAPTAQVSPTARIIPTALVAPQQDMTALPNPQIPSIARANDLAERARELAQIQRLLSAGASTEAIRQLEASMSSDPQSGLAEERDALYVQALVKAQRTTQAMTWARRFIQRYPNSPHVEKMRSILANE